MGKNSFINVLTPTSVDGDISFVLREINTASPTSIPITISVTASQSVLDLAEQIWQGLYSQLNTAGAWYSGRPVFPSNNPIPVTFEVIRTQNILNVWSQGEYEIIQTGNTTKAIIDTGATPIFGTLEIIRDLAQVSGVKLQSVSGAPMTTHQIIGAAKSASSRMIQMLNGFNIIPSTYLQVESGEWQRGVTCRYAPVIKRSPVLARGPIQPGYYDSLGFTPVQRIEFDPWTGSMHFLDFSNSVGFREATDFGNSIVWSYVAGYADVVDALSQICVQTLGLAKIPVEVSSFRGASFQLEFRDPSKATAQIMSALNQFAV